MEKLVKEERVKGDDKAKEVEEEIQKELAQTQKQHQEEMARKKEEMKEMENQINAQKKDRDGNDVAFRYEAIYA